MQHAMACAHAHARDCVGDIYVIQVAYRKGHAGCRSDRWAERPDHRGRRGRLNWRCAWCYRLLPAGWRAHHTSGQLRTWCGCRRDAEGRNCTARASVGALILRSPLLTCHALWTSLLVKDTGRHAWYD